MPCADEGQALEAGEEAVLMEGGGGEEGVVACVASRFSESPRLDNIFHCRAVVAIVVVVAIAVVVEGLEAECGMEPSLLLKAKRSGSNIIPCPYLQSPPVTYLDSGEEYDYISRRCRVFCGCTGPSCGRGQPNASLSPTCPVLLPF